MPYFKTLQILAVFQKTSLKRKNIFRVQSFYGSMIPKYTLSVVINLETEQRRLDLLLFANLSLKSPFLKKVRVY